MRTARPKRQARANSGRTSGDDEHRPTLTIVRCVVKAFPHNCEDVLSQKHFDGIVARIAGLLRQERLHRGLSMSQVAERAGLSQQMISYVERGLRKPNLDTLLRQCAALDLDPAEVLRQATAKRK